MRQAHSTDCRDRAHRAAQKITGPYINQIRRVAAPILLGTVLLGTAVFSLGCQPQRQNAGTAPARQESPYIDHIVQYPGETLSIIANWYTGSGRNWELVLDANPGVDPRRIRLGDLIRIPRELLTREDPMPRSAVPGAGGAASRSRPSGSSAVSSAPTRAADSATVPPQDAAVPASDDNTSRSWDWEEADAADTASGSESQVEEVDIVDEVMDSAPVAGTDIESSAEPVVDSGADMGSEQDAPSVEPVAPSGEMRIKTREELLKELLEE